ncbi:MAG: signal peptide peptidase SppA [Carbonactinosporaceae bacterium]
MITGAKDLRERVGGRVGERVGRRVGEIAGSPPLILELDLTEELVEGPPQDAVSAALRYRKARLQDVLQRLRRAGADPRVRALVARVGGSAIGMAHVQELRDAVLAFRSTGKPAVAWAETFGEFAPGTMPYYLATAFDQIFLQPSGDVGLMGVSVEARFLRDALGKAGVQPEIAQRYEYKNAANVFLEPGFTPAHREASSRIAASAAEQVVRAVAESRGLAEGDVRRLMDSGPLFADEALDAGLVDGLAYRDQVYSAVRRRVGVPTRLRYVSRYRASLPRRVSRRVTDRPVGTVAVIHGHGAIRQGRGGRGLFGASMGSDVVTAAFRAAVRDERVRAIVFRVDSPGGSYVASDAIWRAVVRARAAGKPVVVSMGTFAASGGYFVSAPADLIVAQPGTLTGSIGVLGGKGVTSGLLDKLGVGHDAVAEGRHALMFSTTRAFSDSEWDRVNAWLDRVYDDFVGKVAAGRLMSRERVHDLARGRVWTGADAHARGLVDELGGVERAVALARVRAGIPEAAEITLRTYPKPSPVERIRPPASSEDVAALGALREAWGPVAAQAARLGLSAAGPLVMPLTYEIT